MNKISVNEQIHTLLTNALSPHYLNITDDSHLHKGHPGARNGAGHFTVTIHSQQFADKSLIEQHRLVYDTLAPLIPHQIHALKLKTAR